MCCSFTMSISTYVLAQVEFFFEDVPCSYMDEVCVRTRAYL